MGTEDTTPVRLRLPPLRRRGIAWWVRKKPPRQAAPATPPQEGNCLVGTQKTTPSGCACHPSAGGELPSRYAKNHPVRLRLPPLRRRGIAWWVRKKPPRQASPATPPQEGNCLVGTQKTTPSGFACHPSAGGELPGGYAKNHPVRLRLTPLHRRGIALCRATR